MVVAFSYFAYSGGAYSAVIHYSFPVFSGPNTPACSSEDLSSLQVLFHQKKTESPLNEVHNQFSYNPNIYPYMRIYN